MKINFDVIPSGEKKIRYHNLTHNIMDVFDKNQNLKRQVAYNKTALDIETKEFDENHNIIGRIHKKYTQDGCIETYDGVKQQYIREIKHFIKDSLKNYVEKYKGQNATPDNLISVFENTAGKRIKQIFMSYIDGSAIIGELAKKE